MVAYNERFLARSSSSHTSSFFFFFFSEESRLLSVPLATRCRASVGARVIRESSISRQDISGDVHRPRMSAFSSPEDRPGNIYADRCM